MLLECIVKAFRNLLLPRILKLFLLCLLAYGAGWLLLAWLLSSALALLAGAGILPHLAGMLGGWVIGWVLAWFLFPLLYPILVSFFNDTMARTIEREDYPQLPEAKPPFWPTFRNDVLFSLKAVGLNIILLPLYLVPLVNVVVYYGVNGYLLGTQFFRMAAGRGVSAVEARGLQRKAHGSILLGGVLVSFCATIPFLNLAAPLLGVATMLHLFHGLNGTGKTEIIPPAHP